MNPNFDILPDRRNTGSIKWNVYDRDVIPMWVADMDFRSPEPVLQALRERVEHGIFGYESDHPAVLAELIAGRMSALYDWHISPQDVVFIPGVICGFNLACQAAGKPGDGVVIQTPVYPPFFSAAKNGDFVLQENILPCNAQGEYSIDFDAFESILDERSRTFILCNPHNPVGRVWRKDELERLAEICLSHGLLICSDEIHCDLVFSGHRHLPIAALSPEIAASTITLMAPSKTYNIAGLETSFAIIPNPELRKRFNQARHGLAGWVNALGLVAAEAAYRHGQPWLDAVLKYLQTNRDYVYTFVNTQLPGVRMFSPEGTYLAWLDCRQAGISGSPYEFFLNKARVAVNDGRDFGAGGEGYVRLNFGCPRSMLEEALERMKTAIMNQTS